MGRRKKPVENKQTLQTKNDNSEKRESLIRNKRDRSRSLEALSNSNKQKKVKVNTASEESSESEVSATESVITLNPVNSGGPVKFCDLYQSEDGNALYKFIRKSVSDDSIIYLAGQQDNRLYEYDTHTKTIEEHPLSKFHETTSILSDDYVKTAKSLLLGDSAPEEEMKLDDVKVVQEGVNTISKSLTACVNKWLSALRKEDKITIQLGANSNHGKVLQRAVQAIRDKYGLEIDYAAAVQPTGTRARDSLNGVKLHHATEKWTANMNNDNSETAKLAATWFMSNDNSVQKAIMNVEKRYHSGRSISAIRDAYASAICDGEDYGDLTRLLAESRLRYSPITYGSEIYLAVKNDNSLKGIQETGLFNTLIHEALHSVEHPGFTEFLDTHIPPGLQEDIKEGIVDYLTNQIWRDVQLSEKAKGKYNNDYFEYKHQVEMVKTLIASLEDGDKKLISAYFGGNLGAFLPKLKDMG